MRTKGSGGGKREGIYGDVLNIRECMEKLNNYNFSKNVVNFDKLQGR